MENKVFLQLIASYLYAAEVAVIVTEALVEDYQSKNADKVRELRKTDEDGKIQIFNVESRAYIQEDVHIHTQSST